HRLARGAWKEYDACAPSGCLRVQGILLGGSPRILRLQTVFRILNSARSCRIRVEPYQRSGRSGSGPFLPGGEWFNLEPTSPREAAEFPAIPSRANGSTLNQLARGRRRAQAIPSTRILHIVAEV